MKPVACLPFLAIVSSACITVQIPPPCAGISLDTPVEIARRTNTEMRALAGAVESYAVDHNRYPLASGSTLSVGSYGFSPFEQLGPSLLPNYNPHVPTTDYWGQRYLYWSSRDGEHPHYAILCLGSTGKLRNPSEVEGVMSAMLEPRFGGRIRSHCLQDPQLLVDGQFGIVLDGTVEPCAERGKRDWAWETLPGWLVTSSCEQTGPGQPSFVQVAVLDEADGPLPGVAVNFKRLDAVGAVATKTDPQGMVTAQLEAGQWQIDVNLAGFTRRRYTLLAGDQACKVTFHLSLAPVSSIKSVM